MSYFGNRDFFLEVAKGNVTRHLSVSKFGMHSDIDPTNVTDIWEWGGDGTQLTYPFPSSDETIWVSSDDNGDSGSAYIVTVEGLDQYWVLQTIEDVQLNGNTPVQVGSGETFIRVFRMYSSGLSETAGNVYAANTSTGTAGNGGIPTSDSTVLSYFTISGQQTQQAIYSIPADTTGYIQRWWCSIIGSVGVSQTVNTQLRVRLFEKGFRVQQSVGLSADAGPWQYVFGVPQVIAEKSDIVVQANSASVNNIQVTAGFDIICIEDS